MSLGIVVINNSNVAIMADTQFTYNDKNGKKPYYTTKIFFIDKNTAIAFAGFGVEITHNRIKAIYDQGNKNDLLILAEQISQSFDNKVDFLLAKTGKNLSIAKISNGNVSFEKSKGIFWIGDSEAANFVLKNNTYDIYQLENGLRDAIDNPKFKTVGGHAVLAKGTIDGFKFSPYMDLTSPHYIPKDGLQTIDFGDAQNGGFGYTTVTPVEAGVNGWGIFYFQGRYGLYYHTDLEKNVFEVLKAYAINVQDFIKIIQDNIGINLEYCGSLG